MDIRRINWARCGFPRFGLRPMPNGTEPCFLSWPVTRLRMKSVHSGLCRFESIEKHHSFSLEFKATTKVVRKNTSDEDKSDSGSVPNPDSDSDSDSDSNDKDESEEAEPADSDDKQERKVEAETDSKGKADDADPDDKAKSEAEAKKKKETVVDTGPRFKDLGGMKDVLEQLEGVIFRLQFPKLAKSMGGKLVSGILLQGPPGCGKTKVAHAIANETGFSFFPVSATSLLDYYVGESEKNIRKLFAKAHKKAPSIVFIDEIDAICGKRENSTLYATELTQLLTCMDESYKPQPDDDSDDDDNKSVSPSSDQDEKSRHVLVIAATNRPDSLDPALRRPGRFDIEIFFNVPDENDRVEILNVVTRNLRLEGPLDLVDLARSTSGYAGADLTAVANRACDIAIKRILQERYPNISVDCINEGYNEDWVEKEKEKHNITVADFEKAVKEVQPSQKREGFSAIPTVKWEDVGGLDALRQELDLHIVSRIKYPDIYEKLGMNLETGFLFYGPPGCGKTLIAKAVANEAVANFIHVKGPELLNCYWGESERLVRQLFTRARTCAPCILFFDEVDALTAKRGKRGQEHIERLLTQLLVELDGGEQRKGVIVIGATNRPNIMDPAVLRPGRFGKHVYIPLPSKEERGFILKALVRNKPIDAGVDLCEIAQRSACDNFSGADLAALVHESAMAAVREMLLIAKKGSSADSSPCTIKETHFEQALAKIKPSIKQEELQVYLEFGKQGASGERKWPWPA